MRILAQRLINNRSEQVVEGSKEGQLRFERHLISFQKRKKL